MPETREITEPTLDRPAVIDDVAVRVEEPRRHPLTYLALGLSTLALILSMMALARDDGPDRIRVGNNDCVVVDGEKDAPDSLFCNTSQVPPAP